MKTPSDKFLEKLGICDNSFNITSDHRSNSSRRDFLKKVGTGGLFLGGMMFSPLGDTLAHATSKINRNSSPSELKITDMRYAVVLNGHARCPVIRIDTNQGVYGLGEVRDHASWRYALFLKSRILGMNPCSIEMIFKKIKQFGYHGRQGGGVSAVEMALWDLAGKVYGVPVYQMLGGRYRDKVRLYADTPSSDDKEYFAQKMKDRVENQGFTFLKMDFGIELLRDIPGTVVNSNFWDISKQWSGDDMSYGMTEHPFTQLQLTQKGLEIIADYVGFVRNTVGDIPLASDHYGHFDHNNAIRLGKAVEPYRLAWLEDLIPWKFTQQWKEISLALDTPTTTGEDIYLKEEFAKLVDNRAVDIVHPDLATAGGILETKKIGDYAEENGVAMAMHFAGTPISFMANVHCAAATQNFTALEHHSVDLDYWSDLVTTKKPVFEKGFAIVPDEPGLGVELNEEVVKQHLDKENDQYFTPTPEWDVDRSWDRLWS